MFKSTGSPYFLTLKLFIPLKEFSVVNTKLYVFFSNNNYPFLSFLLYIIKDMTFLNY